MGCNYSNKNLTTLEIGRLLSRTEAAIRQEIKIYYSFFGSARKYSNCLNKSNCHQKYLCDNIMDKIKCPQCKLLKKLLIIYVCLSIAFPIVICLAD